MRTNTCLRATGSLALAAMSWLAPALSAQESPWPMFRHDLKHTGRTPYTGPPTATVAWTFPATDGIVSSPAIAADGTIYFGAGWSVLGATDHHLYALHPDGSLKWSYEGGEGFFSSPALGTDNTVYIASIDRYLYALEDIGSSARRKWKTFLSGPFVLSSPAVGADGSIYVGSASFQFYSLHPDDGSINWSWMTAWCIISSPAIDDGGTIYVGSKDEHLYAFDDALEAPVWQFPTGTFYDGHLVDSSPAIGGDGTIYFGTDPYGAFGHDPVPVDTSFWAVNPDGSLKWSFDTGDGVESSPAIGPDGTIYFGSYDGDLYALTDAGDEGVLQWVFPTNDAIDGSPTVDGDGIVYFGSRDATVYALYPDGSVKWTFETGDGIECSPAIDDRGYLYIGSFDGNLYALGTGGPDVGVVSVDMPHEVAAGATYVPRVVLRNYRGTEAEFEVGCDIDTAGTVVYSAAITVVIPGGASRLEEFSPWLVGYNVGVNYTVSAAAHLVEDENPDNDELSVPIVSIAAPLPGDCDGDGQVNLDDWALLAGCLEGPGVPYASGCDCGDADDDGDTDLGDWAEIQPTFDR
jgi:outer membrane protein assembly factor BamB